jgi:hypothetical protein
VVFFGFTAISCNNDDPDPLSNEAEITAFTFQELNPEVTATINGMDITATVPPGTDVTALTPTIEISEGATIDPESGVAQDFTSPVIYTVTAENGAQKEFTVTVNRELRSEADITAFTLPEFEPDIEATIEGTNITAKVPAKADVTNISPVIIVSEGATVDPASEVAQDFSSPVTYTVTAEDGTQKVYTVTVEKDPLLVATPVWERNQLQGNMPAWFVSHHTRDLAINNNFVFIKNNKQEIRVVSLTNGSDIAVGANSFIDATQNYSSGTYPLLGIGTDSQGRIIGSNLVVNSSSGPWNVFVWENKDANQELLFQYSNPDGLRLGDDIAVTGDVKGNGAIYAKAAQTNKVLKFIIAGGVVNTTPEVISLEGVSLGYASAVTPVSDAPDANLIVTHTELGGIAEFNQSGTLVGQLPEAINDPATIGGALFSNASDAEVFELQGRRVVAAVVTDFRPNMPGNTGYLYLVDITEGWEGLSLNSVIRVPFTPESENSTAVNKTNATGGVDVVVNGDQATVYGLITNFGIGAYNVTFE